MRGTGKLLGLAGMAMGGLLTVASPVGAHSPGQALSEQAQRDELADLLESGAELVEAGDLAEALARYQHAADLDEDNAKIFSAIGYLQARQGNFQAAIAAFQTAIGLEPNDLAVYFGLAHAHSNLGSMKRQAMPTGKSYDCSPITRRLNWG